MGVPGLLPLELVCLVHSQGHWEATKELHSRQSHQPREKENSPCPEHLAPGRISDVAEVPTCTL